MNDGNLQTTICYVTICPRKKTKVFGSMALVQRGQINRPNFKLKFGLLI